MSFNPGVNWWFRYTKCRNRGFPSSIFIPILGWEGRTYDLDEAMKGLDQAGVKAVVNLDGFWGERLDQVLEYTKDYSHRMVTFGNVDISRLDDPDWPEYVAGTLRRSYEKGIRGIKFFKSLSLEEKDKSGNYIPADDDRLQPIWGHRGGTLHPGTNSHRGSHCLLPSGRWNQ